MMGAVGSDFVCSLKLEMQAWGTGSVPSAGNSQAAVKHYTAAGPFDRGKKGAHAEASKEGPSVSNR
jgi:hypothetical protein